MSQGKANSSKGDDRWIPTTCYMCYGSCGIRVHLVDGVVVNIEGDPDHPHNLGRLCAKGHAGLMEIYDPHRLKNPVKRTNPDKGIGVDPKWVEITWEEALGAITERLKRIREEDPRKLVLGGLEFQNFVALWAFASAFGTPNVWKGASEYYCGNALHPITYMAHAAFYAEPDFHHCNYCILVGTQLGFMVNTNAVTMTQMMADARMRGMKLVVVDPIGNNAAAKADEWVPIRPGTDAALMLGMLNLLLNDLGIYDAEFLRKHTNAPYLVGPDGLYVRDGETGKPLVWDSAESRAKAYDATIGSPAIEGQYEANGVHCQPAFQVLKDHVRSYDIEKVSGITTVPASTIHRLAREFGEAARVGSTIVVEGKALPYRPACLVWNRGPSAHKHGMLAGWAIELLNIVVGAIDVPGGLLGANAVGPFWAPQEGPDGLIVPSEVIAYVDLAYPARKVSPPDCVELTELFPVAPYSATLVEESVLDPEKYRLPYRPEMLIQYASNSMISTSNPQRVAEVFKAIPFVVYLGRYLDETAQMADIVLPDARYLERLVPFANIPGEFIVAGPGYWYWNFQQPVVEPPPNVRPHVEVFLELADRAGFLPDYYVMVNSVLNLREPYRLDPSKKYTWEEMVDTWAKSRFGPEHGLDWFKEHGHFVSGRKTVEEAYPRPFLKPRIPVYLEHFKTAGAEVQRVTQELGIPWDVSDYQALPDWKPCPSYGESDGKDLYLVNYKLPFHTFSVTAQNPLLNELAEHHPYAYKVLIPSKAAAERGIKDDDAVWVESAAGRLEGKAKVTECIHPQVVGVAGTFGGWAEGRPIARGKGMHFNSLLPPDSQGNLERLDMVSAALDCCLKVRVSKKGQER